MVKKIAVMFPLLSVVLLGILACATIRTGVPQIDYSQIIDVPGMVKDDLFVKTNLWAVGYFNKSDSVIEYSDKEAGIISGKYIGERHPINGGLSGSLAIRSIFTISIKDEKVKLDLKPAEFFIYNGGGQLTSTSSSVYASVEEADIVTDYNATLESLKQSLTSASSW
jgi:hypothetical protein